MITAHSALSASVHRLSIEVALGFAHYAAGIESDGVCEEQQVGDKINDVALSDICDGRHHRSAAEG
ncbi:hypothetical protein ASF33_06595 [Methylobacterium sp. Leaf92]|nr:hypothetical protein ASF33_06595 [Methylobacterium sp. Leaf92]